MTFLNGILVFGAAAFSIPLLIHLFSRSRFRTVPWGAMHLLESLLRTNRRRMRLEQLILLLIRCAIPVLLALCLARPVMTAWRALPGDAASSLLLLLDDSYSMATIDTEQRQRCRFDRAITTATAIAESLPHGSDLAALMTGGGPTPVLDSPVFDTATLVAHMRLWHAGYGASRFVDSFHAAAGRLKTMANARRELVVLSDFQRSDWDTIDAATRSNLKEMLAAMPVTPHVTLIPIGRETLDNTSVDALAFSTRTLGVNQELQIRARVKNHGPRPRAAATVFLAIDGVRRVTNQIAIGAKSTAQVLFTYRFKTAGAHLVDVQLAADDALPTDNHRLASIQVWDRIPVLLVDGAPSAQPLSSETDFLAVALTPFTLGRAKLADLIETRSVTPRQLAAQALVDTRVVVLANVAQLTDAQVDALSRYVRGGGSLLVFLGNQIDLDWYNRVLSAGPAGLLPMRIESLEGRVGSAETRSTRIVVQRFEHPALAIFNDRANGDLSAADIWKWYRLRPVSNAPTTVAIPTSNRDGARGIVMARFETGDPFLVQHRVGDGLVVEAAIPCDADWSNLPVRPVYLPLVQQLITTLAFQVLPPANIQVGQPLLAVLPPKATDGTLTLTMPDGARRAVSATSRGTGCVVRFRDTRQPGVYTLSGPAVDPLRFVASTERTESRPVLLDNPQLNTLATQLGATIVRSADEYLKRDRDRRFGREVWKPLLLTVLGLMFLELVLQQRFTKVRT